MFTGKATYSSGPGLPELAEDVSDILGLVSPFETPLLDALGDPGRAAHSTLHEWLEDSLLPNTDTIVDETISDPEAETAFGVAHADRFRPGDQIQIIQPAGREVMLVIEADVSTNVITVTRGYGGTTPEAIADGATIRILGNAALEGADRPAARFTNRTRRINYTQIFTAGVEVSGSQLAARKIALADEIDYQKQERLRELARDLENCVINGVPPAANPEGNADTRRTMRGILSMLATNAFNESGDLTEPLLNNALRTIWDQSSARIDTIVVNGVQKRRINGFITSGRSFDARDTRFRDLVSVYESDFGVCRVVLSRWVPPDAVLLLDASRIDVLPLAGRSFHFKKLAATGDSEVGQLIGEYTLELRNENAHGVIRGLSTT